MLIKKTVGLPQVFTNHKALKLLFAHACVCMSLCVVFSLTPHPPPNLPFYWIMNCCRVLDLLSQSFTEFEEIGRHELLEVRCCTDN